MIRRERVTATLDGDFVVFLIGMRINQPLKIHKWWPVAAAMPRMLKELHRHPELGFLGAELWAGRTILVLQYWRSLDQLMDYAKNGEAEHLPAWRAFNRSVGTDGSVGIWHETYGVSAGRYENIYVNMPPFGLAAVGDVHGAQGGRQTARARMRGAVESSGTETPAD
jgi:hypothetical protein